MMHKIGVDKNLANTISDLMQSIGGRYKDTTIVLTRDISYSFLPGVKHFAKINGVEIKEIRKIEGDNQLAITEIKSNKKRPIINYA
tara:strand:- start:53 stop:310 length:258 start_codon:yes stop_codon:yes gene_type:complete